MNERKWQIKHCNILVVKVRMKLRKEVDKRVSKTENQIKSSVYETEQQIADFLKQFDCLQMNGKEPLSMNIRW